MVATIAKRNCLVLIVKNLNKGISAAQTEEGLKTLIGEKNIVNVYFPRAEGGLHTSVANVELLNAPIYKKFVQKTHKMQGKYIRFTPHPRSLYGSTAPSKVALQEWGFKDLNTTLANTVAAIENATPALRQRAADKLDREDLANSVREAIAIESHTLKLELCADMQTLRHDVLTEAHTYTDIVMQDLRSKINKQFDSIDS